MPIADVSSASIAELVSLSGRAGVVTGAGQGIGAAVAKRLAEAGADLILTDINLATVTEVAADLSARHGRRVIPVVSDVTDEAAVEALGDQVVAEFGRLDIWVNNAGAYPTWTLLEMSGDNWDSILDLNLKGAFLGTRVAGQRMIAGGNRGVIINMASITGHKAFGPGLTHYTSSKHGVLGLTKAAALELGPHNIRCVALSPTLIATAGIEESRDDHEQSGLAEQLDALAGLHPLGRQGVPDDVARCALFCASDLSLLVTGSDILVDAGLVAV